MLHSSSHFSQPEAVDTQLIPLCYQRKGRLFIESCHERRL
jgi:hypothetical protein